LLQSKMVSLFVFCLYCSLDTVTHHCTNSNLAYFPVCFHHYAETAEGKAKRGNVPTFWENSKKYEGTGKKGMLRLLGLLHLNPGMTITEFDRREEDRYGIGSVRSPSQLYSLLGIDPQYRTFQGHLCRFVEDGKMHEMLVPWLRDDGMGIDYTHLDYEWVDPNPAATKRRETKAPEDEELEKKKEEIEKEKEADSAGEGGHQEERGEEEQQGRDEESADGHEDDEAGDESE